jgi:4-hydroxybenzoate polyprenyltransferase
MTPADFFFVSASIGIWALLISWLFILYKTFRIVNETKQEVSYFKNNIKMGFLTLISKLLRIPKGGENNGK